MTVGCLLAGGRDVPTSKIARPHIHHFALVDQRTERLPRFVPRTLAIDMVHLIQIDPFGLQPAQAALTVLANLVR